MGSSALRYKPTKEINRIPTSLSRSRSDSKFCRRQGPFWRHFVPLSLPLPIPTLLEKPRFTRISSAHLFFSISLCVDLKKKEAVINSHV